jgi:hypothetical protein
MIKPLQWLPAIPIASRILASLRSGLDVDRDWQEGAHSFDHVLGVMFENRSFDSR